MIDPDQFLNTETQGAMSTDYIPVPADEYIAMIVDIQGPRENFNSKTQEMMYPVDIQWEITDEEKLPGVKEVTGMANPRVKQSLFLDVLQDGDGKVIGLEAGPGKNVGLGRLRAALGQNDPKKAWSFARLNGASARIKVEHNPGKNGEIYANVARKDGVTRL